VSVGHIEILVEEPSMEAALRLLVPRIMGDVSFEVYTHQCKQDLLDKLPARLKGYAAWLPQDYRIVVVIDRDDDDCDHLKSKLERAAQKAGLLTRTRSGGRVYQIVNRLAIEELEAWFFGDWDAVRNAYPRVDPNIPRKQGFRDPDKVSGGTWEALERLLRRAGYFSTGFRKIEAARTIAPHMYPPRNQSHSFCVFRDALMELASCE
jgi:hypothetical protein